MRLEVSQINVSRFLALPESGMQILIKTRQRNKRYCIGVLTMNTEAPERVKTRSGVSGNRLMVVETMSSVS